MWFCNGLELFGSVVFCLKAFSPSHVSAMLEGAPVKRGKGKVKVTQLDDSDEDWGVSTLSSAKKRRRKQKVLYSMPSALNFIPPLRHYYIV